MEIIFKFWAKPLYVKENKGFWNVGAAAHTHSLRYFLGGGAWSGSQFANTELNN